MTPEQASRRWRQARTARARRDTELETFPTTAGASSKTASPMFGQSPDERAQPRIPGLVTEPPAPAGLTSWGTWNPPAIEHVGGGYHLVAINLISQDAGWYDDGDYVRWSICVWLIRPDQTISDAWVSDGNIVRPATQGGTFDVTQAPPYGEPTDASTLKLTRWQEGALLSFTIFTEERQYVSDLSGFWPQSASLLDVPWGANVYRWIGHDTENPVIGPAFELYAGPDDDFPTDGDWDTGSGTAFDDGTTEGFEVVGPSADPNIAVYGLAYNSRRHRIWLLDKDPADHSLSLAGRTTLGDTAFGSSPRLANPGGLTRISSSRWVALSSLSTAASPGMWAALFNAKTGTVVDTVQWDNGDLYTDCYYLVTTWTYHAGNHLHFDGSAVFAGWWARLTDPDPDELSHRYTTLTVEGDIITAGDVSEWARQPYGIGPNQSERWVETCEGCLRLIGSWTFRQQGLFERRRAKTELSPLTSPEFEPSNGIYNDQRAVPTSHPAGYMWASNVALGDTWDGISPIRPKLIRYPA